ncbi:MAG TPA: CPBP family glutamic-type intramembrane protease [Nitrospira sp.]|nr:CPBP family glutamic-type intramembrane protease [Nitrospira sp.]
MGVISAVVHERVFHTPYQRRAAVELLILGLLSTAFLTLFPRRPIYVDLLLALLASALVLLNVRYTSTHIWNTVPLKVGRRDWWPGVLVTMALTALVVLVFLMIGVAIGYHGADWPGAKARILHPYIPTALLLYLPWALLQQTLFQFYLLGRVCTLCPSLHPLGQSLVNGLVFGAVHTTDIWILLLATLGGTLWSFLYLRYRRLWPLVVSHAVIGTTFYYWVYGYDLASRWRMLPG